MYNVYNIYYTNTYFPFLEKKIINCIFNKSQIPFDRFKQDVFKPLCMYYFITVR